MKKRTVIALIPLLVVAMVATLSNCTRGGGGSSSGQLEVLLADAFAATREDSSWAKANTDTYTVYVYSADNTVVANAGAAADRITLDVAEGSYRVVLLAGDKGSDDEVLLLAAGGRNGVAISPQQTTTVRVELRPVWQQITALPLAEVGRSFHATMHGRFPIPALKISQAPSVRMGSDTATPMSTSTSGQNWSAMAQLMATASESTETLYYQGGLLALQDGIIGQQALNLGGYRWMLFTGDTAPYTTTYAQDTVFRIFKTVCLSGACDYSSIQAAVDAAAGGDRIAVRPGTYDENLVIAKPLILYGATWDLIKDNDYPVPAGYAWDDTVESIIVTQDPDTNGNSIDIRDTDDVTFQGFVAHSLNTIANNRQLLRLYALNLDIHNIRLINNVIGPNTNVSDPANYGRMGLYLVPHYGDYGIKDSLVSHNKIVGSGGNGNNIFVWGGNNDDGQKDIADLSGTVIEYNDIYGSRRSGIELAGGVENLTIQHNRIHDNGFAGDDDPGSEYKYGNGICFIRLSSETANEDALWISNITIRDNKIYNNKQFGIYMGPRNFNHTIVDNDIYNNGWYAIQVDLKETYHQSLGPREETAKTSSISFNDNNVYNNGFGASVVGTPSNGFMLDATNNWWGDASGPAPVGSGDGVSASVDSGGYRNQALN